MNNDATRITQLECLHFRNYSRLHLKCDGQFIILSGNNGAGKTNILEALSLLAPGRGFRAVPPQAMLNAHTGEPSWIVRTTLAQSDQTTDIATALLPESPTKRIVHINAVDVAQARLADMMNIMWFLPTMSHLFLESGGTQRRYFDRAVYGFDRAHATRVSRFEHAMRERNKLLAQPYADAAWLRALEETMAELSVAIAVARCDMVARLNEAMEHIAPSFPKAWLTVAGDAEDALISSHALDAEQHLADQLSRSRSADAMAKRASHGAHKSVFTVMHRVKNLAASLCSTGEQKALLMSLLLAQIHAQQYYNARPPVILLDEMVAHLDATRRNALFNVLGDSGIQCFATGTDSADFSAVPRHSALFYHVEDGTVKQH